MEKAGREKLRLLGSSFWVLLLLLMRLLWQHETSLVMLVKNLWMSWVIGWRGVGGSLSYFPCCCVLPCFFLSLWTWRQTSSCHKVFIYSKCERKGDKLVWAMNADNSVLCGNKGLLKCDRGRQEGKAWVYQREQEEGKERQIWIILMFCWSSAVRSFSWLFN